MTDAPALPAQTCTDCNAQTCRGCDWFERFLVPGTGWCGLHEQRMKDSEPACEYRRELEDEE